MYLHRFFFYLQLSKVFYCFTESYRSQSFIWVMAPDTYGRHILGDIQKPCGQPWDEGGSWNVQLTNKAYLVKLSTKGGSKSKKMIHMVCACPWTTRVLFSYSWIFLEICTAKGFIVELCFISICRYKLHLVLN